MINYSQNNEQQVIVDYFGEHFKGTFLDLGANDGQILSNTRALALNGWGGVLVEASATAANKAKDLYVSRPDITVINIAVANHTGTINFFESGSHLGTGDTSLLSTVVESETERWSGEKFEQSYVNCDTIENIIAELPIAGYRFDFISIDIEGMDYETLIRIPLNGVKCVCVEYNGKEPEKYIKYCEQYGLTEIHRNAENLIFAAV